MPGKRARRTIEIIFDRQVRKDTVSEFKTKVVTRGTDVTINAFYRHSRIKQYDDQTRRACASADDTPWPGCGRRKDWRWP
jgi:hypothetical protein